MACDDKQSSNRVIDDTRLAAFCDAAGATISTTGSTGSICNRSWVGVHPPPKTDAFGKGSSAILGRLIGVSCAEVEIALALRDAGWRAGWASAYRPDRRLPDSWRGALISPLEAAEIIEVEFPQLSQQLQGAIGHQDGTPDVLAVKGGKVLVIECKRTAGRYRRADCSWAKYKGDALRTSQIGWLEARREVVGPAYVELRWTRIDGSVCP